MTLSSLIDPKNPAFWADGTKRSEHLGFTLGFTGEPIDWKPMQHAETMRHVSAKTVSRLRAEGRDHSSIAGLSNVPSLPPAVEREHRPDQAAARDQALPLRAAIGCSNREGGRLMAQQITDQEREEHIAACGRLMLKAHAEGDHASARKWLELQNEAIAMRSPAQVAHMEQDYFGYEGEKARQAAQGREIGG